MVICAKIIVPLVPLGTCACHLAVVGTTKYAIISTENASIEVSLSFS